MILVPAAVEKSIKSVVVREADINWYMQKQSVIMVCFCKWKKIEKTLKKVLTFVKRFGII